MEFPIDTLYPYAMVKKEIGMKDSSQTLMQKIVNWYDQITIFGGGGDTYSNRLHVNMCILFSAVLQLSASFS